MKGGERFAIQHRDGGMEIQQQGSEESLTSEIRGRRGGR